MGVADGAPLPGGEERHVGGDAELGAPPDGLTGRLDILHATLGMPADVDAPDLRRTGLARVHRLDTGIAQCLSHPGSAEHQGAFDAAALQVIGGNAGRRDHLPVIYGQARRAQLRRLFRGRVGAAGGEQGKGHPARLECAQNLDRSGQKLIAAQRPVAEQQRAVDIEQHAADRGPSGRVRAGASGVSHTDSAPEPAPPRSSSRKSLFTTESSAMLRICKTRRSSSITGFESGS